MKLWSVFSWQACSCLDGVTTVRPGPLEGMYCSIPREAHLCSLWPLVPGDCGGGHDLQPPTWTFFCAASLSQHCSRSSSALSCCTSMRMSTSWIRSRANQHPIPGKDSPSGREVMTQDRFQESLFWNKTTEYSLLFISSFIFLSRPLLFCFGRDELDCFAVWSPSVWEAEVTAFSRQFSQFVWVATFFCRTGRMCFLRDKEQGLGLKLK